MEECCRWNALLFMPDSNGLLNDWLSDQNFSLSGLVEVRSIQLNIAHFIVDIRTWEVFFEKTWPS